MYKVFKKIFLYNFILVINILDFSLSLNNYSTNTLTNLTISFTPTNTITENGSI